MKKFLFLLISMGILSTANAEIYKITKFTKAQEKQVKAELEESSGDSIAFSTDKGILWIYIESPVLKLLGNAKIGECYDIKGEFTEMKGKKVKCPSKKRKS